MDEKRLLAIMAHPDDESMGVGGALARYAVEGAGVYLITATRGQLGWFGDEASYPGPQILGAIREQELYAAARILGLREVHLLDYMDGALDQAQPSRIIAQLVTHIRRIRPQVVLTFDPNGYYGHPDHIAVSHWTVLAFQQATAPGRDGPRLLYYMAVPASLQQALGLNQLSAIDDAAITLAVDVLPVWERKLAAIRCHRTQLG